MATIAISPLLREFTERKNHVTVEGKDVGEILLNLATQYPKVKSYIFDADGDFCSFMNIYINDEDIRYLQGKETIVQKNDIVSLVTAVAGG